MRWSISSTMLDPRPLRRFWLAALALGLVIALAATVQFVIAPRHYAASQQLRVGILAISAMSQDSGSTAQATQMADAGAIARTLASPTVLAAPQLAGAILAQFSVAERARQHMSLSALETSLSATHSEGNITLSVLWTSPAGADEILSAAVAVLQGDVAVRAALAPSTISARLEADVPAVRATRAPGDEAAAVQNLLTRLLITLVAAALLPYALSLVLPAAVPGLSSASAPPVEESPSEASPEASHG